MSCIFIISIRLINWGGRWMTKSWASISCTTMKLCAFTIFLSLGTESLFWNGYADYWSAIFSVLNFCDWGPPWFQQSLYSFHISLLFLSLVISWFRDSVFWKYFSFLVLVWNFSLFHLAFYATSFPLPNIIIIYFTANNMVIL